MRRQKGVDMGPTSASKRDMDRFNRSTRSARREADSLSASTSRVGITRTAVRDVDRLGGGLNRARGSGEGLHGSLLRAKIVGTALAAIPMAQGFSALSAGAIGATASLGPLAGGLAAIPALSSTAAQSIATVLLAGQGLGDTIGAAFDAQDQAGTNAAAATDRAAHNADQMRSAERGLQDASRQSLYATEELTAAKAAYRRELQDLKDDLDQSVLSERGSEIGLQRAKDELIRAQAEGSALDVDEALNRVDQAREDLDTARTGAARAREDYNKAEAAGVRGSPQVVAAERAKADAVRAVEDANYQLGVAGRQASEGTNKASAAATKYERELAKLSPEARAFALQIIGMRGDFDQLRASAGRDLFPGVGRGVTEASRNLPVLNRILEQTGGALGNVAEDAGRLAGSPAFGRDMALIGERNARWTNQLGHGAIDLGGALTHLTVAAGPFTQWLVDTATGWASLAREEAAAGRRSGETAAFLERTRAKMEQLGRILQSLSSGFYEVGKASTPLGDSLWRSIDRGAQRFEDWTKSAQGQRVLAEWFEDAQHAGRTFGHELDVLVDKYGELRAQGKTRAEAFAIVSAQGASRAMAHAATEMARTAPQVAPQVASAFWQGFKEASLGGKLLTAGFILSRLGGGGKRGGFYGAGRGGAASFASGLSSGLAGGIGGAAVQTGAEKLGGKGGKVGKVASVFAGRGNTPANPLFVHDIAGGGKGVGGKTPPVAPLGRFGGGRALLGAGIGAGSTALGLGLAEREVNNRYLPWKNTRAGSAAGSLTSQNPLGGLGRLVGIGGGAGEKQKAAELQALIRNARAGKLSIAELNRELGKYNQAKINTSQRQSLRATAVEMGKVRNEFGRLRSGAVISMRDIANTTTANAIRIKRALGENSADGRRMLQRNFQLGMGAVRRSMADGTLSTRQGMALMRGLLDTQSKKGQNALSGNFNAVERQILRTMSRGGKLTAEGMAFMRETMVNEMKDLGLSKSDIRMSLNKKASAKKGFTQPGQRGGPAELIAQGTQGRQHGGEIVPGHGPGDKVPRVLPPGSFVLNREAAAAYGFNRGGAVPAILEPRERVFSPDDVKRVGLGNLIAMNQAVPRFQTGGPVGFAKGGIVPIPGEPGESIHSSILSDVVALKKKYKLDITDGFSLDPVHSANGEHPKGLAIDAGPDFGAGGSWGLVSKLAAWAEPSQNHPRPPFRWVGYTGDANHGPGNHIHLSWGGKGGSIKGGVGGGTFDKIARVLVNGPDSPMKSIIQERLDKYRAGANNRGQELADQFAPADTGGIGGLGPGVGAGKGIATRAQMVRWARLALRQTGHSDSNEQVNKILELARKESGWDVDSINNWDINAKQGNPSGGLMHVTIDKVGGSKANLFDPVKNMVASINYQYGKYGGLTTQSPYARGGLVEMLAGGGGPVAQAAKKGPKFKRTGTWKGTPQYNQSSRYTPPPPGQMLDANTKRFFGLERWIVDEDSLFSSDQQTFQLDDVLSQDELNKLVGRAGGIRGAYATQLALVRDAIVPDTRLKVAAFTKLVDRRTKRVKDLVAKVKQDRAKSAKIAKQENEAQKKFAKVKKPTKAQRKARAKEKAKHANQRKKLGDRVDGYQAELKTLTGDEAPDVARLGGLSDEQGLLGAAISKRKSYQDALETDPGWVNKLRASELPALLRGADYTVAELLKQGATKPDNTEAEGVQRERADLLAEQLRIDRLRLAASERSYGVFRDTPRYGGVFHGGGIVPGRRNEDVTITARGREGVFTEEQMQELSAGAHGEGANAPVDLRVIVQDGAVDPSKIRVIADQQVRATTRQMAVSGERWGGR